MNDAEIVELALRRIANSPWQKQFSLMLFDVADDIAKQLKECKKQFEKFGINDH